MASLCVCYHRSVFQMIAVVQIGSFPVLKIVRKIVAEAYLFWMIALYVFPVKLAELLSFEAVQLFFLLNAAELTALC